MPFLAWSRLRGGSGEESAAASEDSAWAKEISRLCSLPAVHRAFLWLQGHEREICDFQVATTRIAAPPFHEGERSAWLCRSLRELGYDAWQDEVANVLALHPGSDPDGRVLAVSAHMDTIFPRSVQVEIRREVTRLIGPGISDNGAGLAALWAIAAALKHCGLRTRAPVLLLANVGEEGEGNLRGMRHVFADERWRERIAQMIVLDGSGTDLVVNEGLGSRRFEVVLRGPGGHSWSDFGAPSPLVAAARAIAVLSRLHLPAEPKTTLSIGTIEGGTSVNAIPETVKVRIDVRSAEAQQLERLELEVRRAFSNAVSEVNAETAANRSQLTHEVLPAGDRPAAELRPDAPILLALRAADARLGIRSKTQRASTDANVPLALGVDALAIGGGGYGGGAHTMAEWFEPVGRDRALKRILLILLALAGIEEQES